MSNVDLIANAIYYTFMGGILLTAGYIAWHIRWLIGVALVLAFFFGGDTSDWGFGQ